MHQLLSVGIDVGTTTTQVAFSRLTLENVAGRSAVPRMEIVNQQVVSQCAAQFTPILPDGTIDAPGVRRLVEAAYSEAGVSPADIAVGAVIVTGFTARRQNAGTLAASLAGMAGDFVVSTAGPDLESVIAGKGSGAWAWSKSYGCRVLNLDIGGGTTNAVLFDAGHIAGTACLDIGGRLVQTDDRGLVTGITEAARTVAAQAGVTLRAGVADRTSLEQLCHTLAELLAQLAGFSPQTPLLEALRTPHSARLSLTRPPDAVCFSGGVADWLERQEDAVFRYGDIGPLLGRAVASRFADVRRIRAGQTLRATVVGAGSHTTSLSGSTICVDAASLPLRNLQVICCTDGEQVALLSGEPQPLIDRLGLVLTAQNEGFALFLPGSCLWSYSQLKTLAAALVRAVEPALEHGTPLTVLCGTDLAKALGHCLRGCTTRPVVCIDGVTVRELDYLDIGAPAAGNLVVPVVVKTLLFGA